MNDALTISYNPNEGGVSLFNVTTENVPPASAVTATAGDFDNDGDRDDVRVRWTASAQPDGVYDIIRSSA